MTTWLHAVSQQAVRMPDSKVHSWGHLVPCGSRPDQEPACWHSMRSGGLCHSWVALESITCSRYFMQHKFNKPIVFAINSNCTFKLMLLLFLSTQCVENQTYNLTYAKKKGDNIETITRRIWLPFEKLILTYNPTLITVQYLVKQ